MSIICTANFNSIDISLVKIVNFPKHQIIGFVLIWNKIQMIYGPCMLVNRKYWDVGIEPDGPWQYGWERHQEPFLVKANCVVNFICRK